MLGQAETIKHQTNDRASRRPDPNRSQTQNPSREMKRRIAIAMSGGVDSSVAAYLLQRFHSSYADFVGLHMSNWNSTDEDAKTSFCVQSEKDANDAQLVCDHLKIRMHRVSFAAEYWTGVFQPFLNALDEGLMPNPDGMYLCNIV